MFYVWLTSDLNLGFEVLFTYKLVLCVDGPNLRVWVVCNDSLTNNSSTSKNSVRSMTFYLFVKREGNKR